MGTYMRVVKLNGRLVSMPFPTSMTTCILLVVIILIGRDATLLCTASRKIWAWFGCASFIPECMRECLSSGNY
jgi:hypothetical protein